MTNSDKSCTCHPELDRHQCTYPIFFQWSPESWLRARFEACRWGQCTIHLQARGVWAQTPVKVCSMQQKPEAFLSLTLTVSEVWDQERVCWSSTHIFQKIPRHWGENESCFFLFYMMQQTMSIRICNIRSVAHHKWRTPAGVSWCRGSRGPQRSECQPGLSSSLCHDTCVTPSSEPRATNTLQWK